MRVRHPALVVCVAVLGLCWADVVSSQQTLVDSVDVLFNLTLSGVDPATLNVANLNGTEVIERLNTLATENSEQYGMLLNSFVKTIADQLNMNTVNVLECATGGYIDSATGLCTPCRAGTYSETPRATSASVCLACPPGTFSNVSGANSSGTCRSCPSGTFSGVSGANSSSVCQGCGAGMTSVDGAQSMSACVCSAGYYLSSGVCVFCEPGFYCGGNVKNQCPGQAAGISSSLAGSRDVSDCYCRAGYFGLAGSLQGCQLCGANQYCTGQLQNDADVKNYAVVNQCPENSNSDAGSVSLDQCKCIGSYRKKQSSYAQRFVQVTAQPCNCTNAYPCGASGGGTCASCGDGVQCVPGTTVTCRQGHVQHVGTSTSYNSPGFPSATASWLIAPAGATRVFLKLYDVNTGGPSNTVKLFACLNVNCSVSDRTPLDTVSSSLSNPKWYATTAGYGVVKVDWLASTNVGALTPFKVEYSSLGACEQSGTIPVTLGTVYFPNTGQTVSTPTQVDASWPLVTWVDDQVTFSEYPSASSVAVDVVDASWNSVKGSFSTWQPSSTGIYYLVDLAMRTRFRALWVMPSDPRTLTVYYSLPVGSTSFTVSGDVSGSGSPDIVLVQGDTLVMSRLSGASGVMLLTAWNATSKAYTVMSGADVVGQSTASVAQTSLTWDTKLRDAGTYYYASAATPGTVSVGRILLYGAPGGAQCVVCQVGEYCYDGSAVRCPPNSVSPPGSTSVTQCQCSKGFATSTTDLDSYGNSQTVDSGGRHSCVVSQNGTLWCWGANEKGQLGLGVISVSEAVPREVPGLADVRNVSLGDDFTCVVVGASMRVKCWGDNWYGQLGLDSDMLSLEYPPGDASAPAGLSAWAVLGGTGAPLAYSTRTLSCAKQSCCAVVDKGTAPSTVEAVVCWGRGDSNQLGEGASQTLLRKNIGTGLTSGFANTNTRYSYAATGTSLGGFGSNKVALVTMGGEHACAVTAIGTVFCWGSNLNGAIGKGTGQTFYNPVEIDLGGKAKTVNCLSLVCCAVMKDAYNVKCWGKGGDGRLGTGMFDVGQTGESMGSNLQAVSLGTGKFAIDVNVGQTQTCALLSTNAVKCWGLLSGNVIGDNPPIEMSDVLPNVELLGTQVVLQMSGKGLTTCVVMSDYRVVCWGDNSFGQLGGSNASGPMSMTLVEWSGLALKSSGMPQSVSCSICASNTYCVGGNSLAQTCPANTASPIQSTQIGDCKCLPGYKRVGSTCVLCTGAEYCLNGLAYACGANSATVANGSSTASQCQCAKGHFWSSALLACTPCGWGTYKDVVGNAGSCTSCPAGTRSNQSAVQSRSGCVDCGAGTFSSSGSAVCTACGAGFAAGAGSSACSPCGAGFFSDGTESACRPCPAGTFDGEPRNGEPGTCAACPAGTFSGVVNATDGAVCRPCRAGTVSDGGAGSCRACGVGEYSLEGVQSCQQCPQDSTSANGSAYGQCTCLAGLYKKFEADGVTFACDACAAGRFSGANSSACQLCPAGTAGNASRAVSLGACEVCKAGRFSAAGSTVCSTCGVWSFSGSDGAASCANCSLGYYAAAGSSACSACPPGKFSTSAISSLSGCQTCPAGSYCVGAVLAGQRGVAQVATCPLGTYNLNTGLNDVSQCTPCPPNSFCPNPTLKGECPAGTGSNASSSSQLQCVCMQGYSCSYKKVVNAVVTLLMTVADWNSNLAVREAFKEAVAKSAKTTKDKVTIVDVVAGKVASGGGARRRMLSAGGGAGSGVSGAETHVMLEIYDGIGETFGRELGGHLDGAGLKGMSGELAWIEPHSVVAVRAAR